VVEVKQTLDFTKILKRLKEFNSATYRYIFYHPISGLWLGVTPELLLQSTGSKINTVSLAGTKPINSTLPWGEKEREEQAYVTQYIDDVLCDLGYEKIVFDGPKTSPAPPVEHLKTYISAQHNSSEMHDKLLQNLHPTPAVCGVPKQEALQLIQSFEPHSRYYYTGFFGWTTKQSAEFYVNLRCALYQNNSWNLFVGGGLTAQSNLHDEWNETALKAQTLMAVIN
jgi:isochorismate synthase